MAFLSILDPLDGDPRRGRRAGGDREPAALSDLDRRLARGALRLDPLLWLGCRYGPSDAERLAAQQGPGARSSAASQAFARWGPGAVFVGHFFGPLRSIVFIAAGVSLMRALRFQLANIPGALIWAYAIPKSGEIGGSVLGHLWSSLFGA